MRTLILMFGLVAFSSAGFAENTRGTLMDFINQIKTHNVSCKDEMKNNQAVSFKIISGQHGLQVDTQNVYTVSIAGVFIQESPLIVFNFYRSNTLNPSPGLPEDGDRHITLQYDPSAAAGTPNVFTVNGVQVDVGATTGAHYRTVFNYQCSF